MKWCKFVAFFDNFDDFISDDCGACKLLAAMDNTVTNCIDLFKRFDNGGENAGVSGQESEIGVNSVNS